MEDHSQSPWYSQAKEHWKKYRPKMYAALEKKGTLHKHLNAAVEQTRDEYAQAIYNGMEPHEAWEAVRENHLFLPSEEDQPSLGEDPNPEPEPIPVAEILAPREYATPEEVKHFLARARRLLAQSPEKLRDMPSPSKRIH